MVGQFRNIYSSGLRVSLLTLVLLALAACGGSGGGSEPPAKNTYAISGTVSGLTGSGLTLQNNGGNDLSITADGNFSFSTKLNDADSYDVTVSTQPDTPPQICSVNNGGGTVSGADITNVTITCVSSYTVSGTVSGLNGSGFELQINTAETLKVSNSGTFSFNTKLASGSDYTVTVYRYPVSPIQTCIISKGSGTITGADISDVAISCTTPSSAYTFGGNVSGLSGTGLVLQSNTGEELPITSNGNFAFSQPLGDGSQYIVSVFSKPSTPSQTCSITNGTATLAGSNVTNIAIACVTDNFSVGGSVTGLVGDGLVLSNYNNIFTGELTIVANGNFTFSPAYGDLNFYSVGITSQPSNPKQTCTVTNSSGKFAGANITNVTVTCVTDTYFIGGSVRGLMGSGLILQNNKGDTVNLSANGVYSFSTSYNENDDYSISVTSHPATPQQTCRLVDAKGTIATTNITNISVVCEFGWQWSNPKPQGNSLVDVVWNGSLYVAVGHMGSIITSPDGVTWTLRDSGLNMGMHQKNLYNITWTGSKFFAYGFQVQALSSTDGISWTETGTNVSGLYRVHWNGTQFVGLRRGFGSTSSYTSTDGINWGQQNPVGDGKTAFQAEGLAWNGTDQYVVVSLNAQIASSSDGQTWTRHALPSGTSLKDVIWTGSQYVAVGRTGAYVTSPDGTTWTVQTPITSSNLTSIVWTGSQYVASSYTTAFTSPNGSTWTSHDLNPPSVSYTGTVNDVIWANGQLLSVSAIGSIKTSSDGAAWTERATAVSFDSSYDIIWDGAQYVAVGQAGMIITSPDGVNWTSRVPSTTNNLIGIVKSNNLYVAVGRKGTVATSTNSVDWVDHSIGGADLAKVAWTGSSFVAVGSAGNVQVSSDGSNWTAYTVGTDNLRDVTWTGSLLVAVGFNGVIYTSPDGTSWTSRTSGITEGLNSVVWTGQQLVAVGRGSVVTSPDGVTWTTQDPGTGNTFTDVIWTGDNFVAVCGSGGINTNVDYLYTSPDGVTWTWQVTLSNKAPFAVVKGGNQLLMISGNGKIMRTTY